MKYFLFILCLFSLPAMAEDAVCGEKNNGAVKCMDSRLCECKFSRGGSITDGQNGYKWDCSITRPSCGAEFNKIETDQKKYEGPNSVNIDKSSVNVNP